MDAVPVTSDSTPVETAEGASQLEWSRAVQWAVDNIDKGKISRKAAGSTVRYTYWKLGRENSTQLLLDIYPRALAIMEKNKKTDVVSGMVAAEADQIRDLEELLSDALIEAGAA